MIIENPNPTSWQELQSGIARIFNEIGLKAEVEKRLSTPRGIVELDIYAVDEKSVDKIRYAVECKNWNVLVPQSVVHSFTTVMHEIGANIGFIISKKGLQSGAIKYTKNTNILGMTYSEFQERYFQVWYERWFVTKIGNAADSLIRYVEPFNSFRERKIDALSKARQKQFVVLYKKYQILGIFMASFHSPSYSHHFAMKTPDNFDDIKGSIRNVFGKQFAFRSTYIKDLLCETIEAVNQITDHFNDIFKKNIFSEYANNLEPV
jgi:restriction system protein